MLQTDDNTYVNTYESEFVKWLTFLVHQVVSRFDIELSFWIESFDHLMLQTDDNTYVNTCDSELVTWLTFLVHQVSQKFAIKLSFRSIL